MKEIEILFPDTDYENLILRWGSDKGLDFYSKDKDGDISVDLCYNNEYYNIYLNQEQIKELIKFLNKQVVNE
jgi:hypothetical protein